MNKHGDSNKACSWEFFLKKNKKNSMLIRDFRVVYLATSQFFYMAMNPRLRFSVRRHNEDLKKWLDFAIRQQIYYVHPKLLKSRTRSTSARAYPLMSLHIILFGLKCCCVKKKKKYLFSWINASFLLIFSFARWIHQEMF